MPKPKKPIVKIDINDTLLKPEWMRSPSWRWSVVQSYLADPLKPYTEVKCDKYLSEAVQFYKDRKKYLDNPAKLKKDHPESSLAFELYCANRPGGWRWYLEALMMTDTSNEDIKKILKVDCPLDTLNIFQSMFFDVRPYRESEVAVYANILSTSRASITNFNNHDYTWKMFSYCWGAEDFIEQFCFKAKEPNAEHRKWFRAVSGNNITVNTFHTTNDMRLLYNQQALEVIRTAQTFWTIAPEDKQTAESIASNGVLSNLLGQIDVSLMSAELKLDAIEPRYAGAFADFSFN
jgi:hypothetical protein